MNLLVLGVYYIIEMLLNNIMVVCRCFCGDFLFIFFVFYVYLVYDSYIYLG